MEPEVINISCKMLNGEHVVAEGHGECRNINMKTGIKFAIKRMIKNSEINMVMDGDMVSIEQSVNSKCHMSPFSVEDLKDQHFVSKLIDHAYYLMHWDISDSRIPFANFVQN